MNTAVSLDNVVKSFGSCAGIVRAVDGITLEVRSGEFFSLLGPSGCGKTTLLRLIAGFEAADFGNISVQGHNMAGVPPQARPVNTVFQNYALFPHLNVFENIAFGLRMKKISRDEIQRRVAKVMELTHVDELSGRVTDQLSGGQKQRVALARAIVNEPAVLLLDEPLAAIDAKLRGQLQSDLRALQRQLGTTFIYVTHDQDEALSLSDRIAVLNRGKVLQVGTPHEIYEGPRSKFVASFLGGCNIFSGKLISPTQLQSAFGEFRVNSAELNSSSWGIRREDVEMFPPESSVRGNCVSGEILDVSYTGPHVEYLLRADGETLRALMPSNRTAEFSRGAKVLIRFAPESIHLFQAE